MDATLNFFSQGHTDNHPQDITLSRIVSLITQDLTVKDLTEKFRYYSRTGDNSRAARCKRKMPCFSVAVYFQGGKSFNHILRPTGLSLCDFDDLTEEEVERIMAAARKNPHVLMAYVTISGHGVRILFSYCLPEWIPLSDLLAAKNDTLYKEVFRRANEYFSLRFSLPADAYDGHCCNCTRLSGISYCPEVYYNPDAEPLPISMDPPRKSGRPKKQVSLSAVLGEVEDYLSKHDIRFVPGSRNTYISRACYLFRDKHVPYEEALEWAEGLDYGEPVKPIVQSCYRQKGSTEGSSRMAGITDIQEYLRDRNVTFRHNLLSRRHEMCEADGEWMEVSDLRVNSLYVGFCTKTGRRMNIHDLRILIESDYFPDYHPLREYLQSLPEWDGIDYIDQLASTVQVIHCEQSFHNRYFKKWFVTMIACWMDSEKSNHEILTYIGSQGIYKSTFMRNLLPPQLRSYFCTKHFNHSLNRDDRMDLSEKALISLEEIDVLSARELNQLNAIVGNPEVDERGIYERYREKRNQLVSFCATGNNPHFLSGPLGNRRWLPFLVSSIDSPYEHPFCYTGLYSQAYALYRSNFRYWFTPEEQEVLYAHNQHFEEPSLEAELILSYFALPTVNFPGTFYTSANIIERISGHVRHSFTTRNISIWMNKLGFPQHRVDNKRGWRVIVNSAISATSAT